MTNEDKELLLKDLCARLPYGVMCKAFANSLQTDTFPEEVKLRLTSGMLTYIWIDCRALRPYLRPMSSLIGKELDECRATCKYRQTGQSVLDCATPQTIDYLNAHYFDYRGLIEKGLALEAHKGMYEID